jgi:hypothetical protein
MLVPVYWYLKHRLCYDQTFLDETLSNTATDFFDHMEFTLPAHLGAGGIVVIPGRQCVEPPANDVPGLKQLIADMPWAVVMIVGDEESRFPFQELMMPHTRVWVMSPVKGRHDRLAGRHVINGSQPELLRCIDHLQRINNGQIAKPLDWFFAGQVTHPRRVQCVEQLRKMSGGELIETKGFLQGISPMDYYLKMLQAKVIPCPSGPVELSCARIFEAIECGCVPIVDGKTPYPEYKYAPGPGYWEWFFDLPSPPFPVIYDWSTLPQVMNTVLADWAGYQGRISKWWNQYKASFRERVMNDVKALRT